MAKSRRYKPSLESICKIGTIAYNRSFTARDMREYSANGRDAEETPQRIAWLKKHGHLRDGEKSRTYYPTAKGWKMIESACRVYARPKDGHVPRRR